MRRAVLEATDGRQVPWDSSSLTGPVILNTVVNHKAAQQTGTAGPEVRANSDNGLELAFWNSIESEQSKSYFETYLKRFPDGLFADIARLRINELDARIVDDKGAQTQSRPLSGEVEASQGTSASQSPALANVARVQQDQPKAYSSPERARRIAVAELPPDADARLTAAVKALRSYELRYGSFRGNLYLAVLATMDWNSARGWAQIAEGHLVTLSDQDENEFVFELFARDVRFIHVGVKGMDVNGPWIGLFQPAESREPGGGWMWITGESASVQKLEQRRTQQLRGR